MWIERDGSKAVLVRDGEPLSIFDDAVADRIVFLDTTELVELESTLSDLLADLSVESGDAAVLQSSPPNPTLDAEALAPGIWIGDIPGESDIGSVLVQRILSIEKRWQMDVALAATLAVVAQRDSRIRNLQLKHLLIFVPTALVGAVLTTAALAQTVNANTVASGALVVLAAVADVLALAVGLRQWRKIPRR
jgi:hypothetical protein